MCVDETETDSERAESVTCLAFEPTMPSRVSTCVFFYQVKFMIAKCSSWLERGEEKLLDVGCILNREVQT